MKVKNCEDCQKEFEYEPPANYPDKRKYCSACSAAKKAQWEGKEQPITGIKLAEKSSGNGFKLTEENIRIGALDAGIHYAISQTLKATPDQVIGFAKIFEPYIRNG